MLNNSTFSAVKNLSESERLTGNQGFQKFHLSLLAPEKRLCVLTKGAGIEENLLI